MRERKGTHVTSQRTIDVHAHVLTEDMMRRLCAESAHIGPRLSEIDENGATLQVAGITQRPFPRGGWDIDLRIRDMDAHGIDMQVLSVLPQTFLYDQDASLAASFCAIQNEAIAAIVKNGPDRFLGLAGIPLQAPERAATELRRSMRELGLKGALIGSHVEGRNLDDPELEPVWATAAELGALVLIHPQKVAAAERLGSYYFTNLIGNPLETTIAAGSLVFGGVLERHPALKICLSHGGGYTPYQIGRFAHGWSVRPEAKRHLSVSPEASIRRLLFDTILHADEPLKWLVETYSADHVMLGSDYPFDMGMFDCVTAVRRLEVPEEARQTILGRGVDDLFARQGAGSTNTRAA
jgi:aminocarboxymuconate-semialdehyde decarboxylase